MRSKGIALVALLFAALAYSAALEESILLAPGSGASRLAPPGSGAPGSLAISPRGPASVLDPILGGWQADNAVTAPGFRGGTDFVLAPAAYRVEDGTDLLLHFEPAGGAFPSAAAADTGRAVDEAGRWAVQAGAQFRVEAGRAAIGSGAASFRGSSSSLRLEPGRASLLAASSSFRDFSIEFWLYPATADNGEVILSWKSVRTTGAASLPQSLTCAIAGGRVDWNFQGFFARPLAAAPAGRSKNGKAPSVSAVPATPPTAISLRGNAPLLPRAWSHHLLRFDGDTGLLEYLVNGKTEAVAYATSSGHEGGEVWEPAVGAAAPLVIAPGYSGLMDEFRLSRSFVDAPTLSAFGRDGGLVLSPVADLGYGNSRLLEVDVQARTPGATGIELSYRISDEWIGWRFDNPPWIPLRPGERLPDSARGRYVQIRADLYPDGTGKLSPALSAITLKYEPDPLPPPPARLVAIAKDGAIELRWSRVPDSDVAGYLIYYGSAPGEYYGSIAAEGPSPVDAGNLTTFTLTGLPNGGLVYLAVATYDAASRPGGQARRAGEFSVEVSARPSRTAR